MISDKCIRSVAKDYGFTQNKKYGPASLIYKPLKNGSYLGILFYVVGKKDSMVVHLGFGNTAVEAYKAELFNIPKNLVQELIYYIDASPFLIDKRTFTNFLSTTDFDTVANECIFSLINGETPQFFASMGNSAKELVLFDALVFALHEKEALCSEKIQKIFETENHFKSKQLSFMYQRFKEYGPFENR